MSVSKSKKQFDNRPKFSRVTREAAKEGGVEPKGDDITKVLDAVRAKCLDCSGGLRTEVERCTVTSCPLLPLRHGINPFRKKRRLDELSKQQLAERLQKARENAKGR